MSESSWMTMLRPASFAGVGFYVRTHKEAAGRQKAVNIIPFGRPDIQDQGALPQRFTVTAYLIGPGWLLTREALLKALYANSTAQTLVLPYKGPLSVQIMGVSSSDEEDALGYGEVEFECVIDNNVKSPAAKQDFATTLLDNIEGMAQKVQTEYQNIMGPIITQASVLEYASSLLSSASSAALALPSGLFSGGLSAFAAAPSDVVATSTAVTSSFLSASDNAAALASPAASIATPVSGVVVPSAPAADATMGLATLANWGENLTPAPLYPVEFGVAQTAVVSLVQQSAGLALINFYAQTNFTNAQAASAARTQLAANLETIGAAIIDAGQVDLYRTWTALSAIAVQDMITRVQNLPNIADYNVKTALPDVVLAQMLVQDGRQGDALAQLNNAVHPLFMPLSGQFIEAQ